MPLHHSPLDADDMPPQDVHTQQPPQPINTKETVMLLDWDDTLLCSSFLSAHSLRLDSELSDLRLPAAPTDSAEERRAREVTQQLKELEAAVYQLLASCIHSGHIDRTLIITNAEAGWVQMSAAKFLPSILPLLPQLTIISARTCFEHLFPDSPLKWKYYSMHSSLVGGGFFGTDGRAEVAKSVISLGDSHIEREAVRALCKGVPATHVKTVKFSEMPSCEQLRRQIELVCQCFNYIASHPGDLDLQLTVTNNGPTDASSQPSHAADSQTTGAAAESKAQQPGLHMQTDAEDDPLSASEAKDASPQHARHHSRAEFSMQA